MNPDQREQVRRDRESLKKLRLLRDLCEHHESRLTEDRKQRDSLALALVDAGFTWREVADAAGFEDPYIATLQRKMSEGKVV